MTTTLVLVHGGGSSSRFWDRLLPHLEHPAVAVDLPGRGDKPADLNSLTVDEEVASVVDDLQAIDGDLALVVHSSGGLVVPGVVEALGDRIVAVVLNAASVPPEGGCGLDCMKARHADGVRAVGEQARRTGEWPTTAGPPADPEAFRRTYGGPPLDDETLAYVVDPARCVHDTIHHYFQPVHWSRAAGVPVTYLLNELDRPIPAALQQEMLERLPVPPTVVRLDAGHIPAVTDPVGFARVVTTALAGGR